MLDKAISLITANLPLSWEKREVGQDIITEAYLSWEDNFTPLVLEFILDSIQGEVSCKVQLSFGTETLSQIGTVQECICFCKDQIREMVHRLEKISEPAVLFVTEPIEYKDLQPLEKNGEVTILVPANYYTQMEVDVKAVAEIVSGALPVRVVPWSTPKLLLTVRAQD